MKITTIRTAALPRWAALAALLAAGCASAPSRFYTLASTATAPSGRNVPTTVLVGPVSVPAAVDRPEFVVQVAPNRVDVNEFHRWIAPLGDGIAHALAGDLSTLLGTSDVAVAPLANFQPDFRVTLDVQRFEATMGSAVVVDAVWTVHDIGGGKSRSGRSRARSDVSAATFEALAAAYSRAIGTLSRDVAGAIRAMAKGGR